MRIPETQLMIIVVLLLTAAGVHGQGFLFTPTSPRSLALGGVCATGFNDSANGILNPAALPKVNQTQVMISGGANKSDLSYQSPSGDGASDSGLTWFPFAGITFDFNSRLVGASISASTFGRYSIKYPDSVSARYQGTDMDYRAHSMDLAIGFIPSRDFALGIRVGYLLATTTWNRKQNAYGTDPSLAPQFDADWKVDMSAHDDIVASAGMIWTPSYRFELGLTWRPPLAHHFHGDLTVHLPESQGGDIFQSDLRKVRMTIPQEVHLGTHWIASERLDFYMEAVWTQFSQVDQIDLTAKTPHAPAIPKRTIIPVDLKDEYRFHSGLEILTSPMTTLRMGAFYATATARDDYESVLMSSGGGYGVTAGLGLRFSRSNLDIGIGRAWHGDQDVTGEKLPFPLTATVSADDYFGSISYSVML